MARLTQEQKEKIEYLILDECYTCVEVAAMFGVSRRTIERHHKKASDEWFENFSREWAKIYPGNRERKERKERNGQD